MLAQHKMLFKKKQKKNPTDQISRYSVTDV